MRILILLIMQLLLINSVYADVYKCESANKKIKYQSDPCSTNSVNQGVVKIEKLDERQQEEAQNRLKVLAEERQTLDQAAQKQQETDAIRREAAAARQDAAAARREAEIARQQSQSTAVINPYPVILPYPGYDQGYSQGYYPNHHHQHNQGPVYTPGLSANPMFSPNPNPGWAPYPTSPVPPPYQTVAPVMPYRR